MEGNLSTLVPPVERRYCLVVNHFLLAAFTCRPRYNIMPCANYICVAHSTLMFQYHHNHRPRLLHVPPQSYSNISIVLHDAITIYHHNLVTVTLQGTTSISLESIDSLTLLYRFSWNKYSTPNVLVCRRKKNGTASTRFRRERARSWVKCHMSDLLVRKNRPIPWMRR
jgi:hypothetical protein